MFTAEQLVLCREPTLWKRPHLLINSHNNPMKWLYFYYSLLTEKNVEDQRSALLSQGHTAASK